MYSLGGCLRNTVDFPSKQINISGVMRMAFYQDICKNRKNFLVLSQKQSRRHKLSLPWKWSLTEVQSGRLIFMLTIYIYKAIYIFSPSLSLSFSLSFPLSIHRLTMGHDLGGPIISSLSKLTTVLPCCCQLSFQSNPVVHNVNRFVLPISNLLFS